MCGYQKVRNIRSFSLLPTTYDNEVLAFLETGLRRFFKTMQQHDPKDKKLILKGKTMLENVTVVKSHGILPEPEQKEPHFTGRVSTAAECKRKTAETEIYEH